MQQNLLLTARCADFPAGRPDHHPGLAIVAIAGGYGSESDIVLRIEFCARIIRYILFFIWGYTVAVAGPGGPDGVVLGSPSLRSLKNFIILRPAAQLDESRTRTQAEAISGSRDHAPVHQATRLTERNWYPGSLASSSGLIRARRDYFELHRKGNRKHVTGRVC